MDDSARRLAEAREQLEALKKSGLSTETLIALLNEGNQPQQQQQQPQQQQPQQQQQQLDPRFHQVPQATQSAPNLSYKNFNVSSSTHAYRVSISSSSHSSSHSSSSNRDSVFSTASSTRTTASSSSNQSTDSKFWCTSCEKTFKRKFDWKRHLEEFHERSRKYPCPDCNQSFWGPNTFNQHHKSAHGCQTCPHAENVVKHMPKRKAYGCGFCAALHRAFEKHVDHVAIHFDSGSTKADWLHSNVIYGLLHQDPILEMWKNMVANQDMLKGLQPQFSWIPETTGRAQGYVENEHPGQLQDLLEFFDGSKESAEKIVFTAWRTVQVLPKGSGMLESPPQPRHSTSSNMHKMVYMTPPNSSRGSCRRTMSNAAYPSAKRADTRGSVPALFPAIVPETTFVQSPQSIQQQPPTNSSFSHGFVQQQQPQTHSRTLDKELPPVPMGTEIDMTAMNLDLRLFGDAPSDSLLLPPDLGEDWNSITNTLVGEDLPMTPGSFAAAAAAPSWAGDIPMFEATNHGGQGPPPAEFR
ncbi:hypothetical protein DL768_005795 [Monosporascus sp. mg162]|nr:hypothetical protein DL768_005795 [Monosporascus sp. mg162]